MTTPPISWRSLPPFVRVTLVIVAFLLFLVVALDGHPNTALNDATGANSRSNTSAVQNGRGNPNLAIVDVRPISPVSKTSNGEESSGPIQVKLGDVVAYSGLLQAAPTSTLTATPTASPTLSGLDNYIPLVPNSTPTIYITNVDGRFFYPPSLPATAVVVVTTQTPPAFTQQFPLINFNPPQGYTCAGVTVDSWTHPLTDVDESNPCAFIIAQATFPAPTPSLQAGVSPLDGYQAVFLTNLYVSQAADITFHVQSDDSFIWGIGPRIGDPSAQPTRVSGIFTPGPPPPPTPYPTTAFGNYAVVAQHNDDTYRGEGDVTIHFPAEGFYPIEIDNSENALGFLFITLESPAYTPVLNGPSPTPTVAPTVTCSSTSQWCTDLSPNVGTGANELRGVSATSNSDVWAVGGYDITDQGGQPLVEHWNGSIWATHTPSSIPTVGILNGVAALTSTDVWAVSDSGVIHWNGTNWATSSAPNGAKAVSTYTAATPTAYDVWAVGTTNIEYFNGTSWSVSTPVPSGGVLNGVAAIDHSHVWTVGNVGASPLVLYYTGSWATVAIPTPVSAVSVSLNSVDAYSTKSVWIAGTYYANGHDHTLIEYWNGTTWQIVPSPNPTTGDNDLYKVYVTYPGDVWAVGAYDENGLGPQGSPGNVYTGLRSLILHWDGQVWTHVDSPSYGVGSQALGMTGATSLSLSGQIVSSNWAVGSYISSGTSPSQTFIEHITPPAYPARTTSYYELYTDPTIHHQQGCDAGSLGVNGLVILDYGQPRNWSNSLQPNWGSYLVPGGQQEIDRQAHIPDITTAVEGFIDGYVQCVPSGLPQIHVAISINNDVYDAGATLTANHAKAWAKMVQAVQDYARSYPQVFVSAGIDAEPNFDPGCYQGGWCGDSQMSNTEKWL